MDFSCFAGLNCRMFHIKHALSLCLSSSPGSDEVATFQRHETQTGTRKRSRHPIRRQHRPQTSTDEETINGPSTHEYEDEINKLINDFLLELYQRFLSGIILIVIFCIELSDRGGSRQPVRDVDTPQLVDLRSAESTL